MLNYQVSCNLKQSVFFINLSYKIDTIVDESLLDAIHVNKKGDRDHDLVNFTQALG